MKFCWNI